MIKKLKIFRIYSIDVSEKYKYVQNEREKAEKSFRYERMLI